MRSGRFGGKLSVQTVEGRGEASLIYLLGSSIAGDPNFEVFLSVCLHRVASRKTQSIVSHTSDVGSVSSPSHLRRAHKLCPSLPSHPPLQPYPCSPLFRLSEKLIRSAIRSVYCPQRGASSALSRVVSSTAERGARFIGQWPFAARQSDHSPALSSLPPSRYPSRWRARISVRMKEKGKPVPQEQG